MFFDAYGYLLAALRVDMISCEFVEKDFGQFVEFWLALSRRGKE
jgi:hypothetical protein